MTKTAEQLKANFVKRHGHLPGQKPAEPVTAEQEAIIRAAVESRDKAAASPSYAGADYLTLIDSKRKEKKCDYITAAALVLKTPEGQAARNDYLRRKNPGINI